MPDPLRNKFVEHFWRLEKLRGIKFSRPRMPVDAVDRKMRIITAVDAANSVKIIGVWGMFRRKNGKFSCQHIISRSVLANEDSSIPKEELEALMIGSNLMCVVRMALGNWISEDILIGDSTIALC